MNRDFISEMVSTSDSRTQVVRDVKLRTIRHIMDRELTPKQRHAVEECLLRGKTFQSVADADGVNKSTIHRNYYSGLAKLRRFLQYTQFVEKELIKNAERLY